MKNLKVAMSLAVAAISLVVGLAICEAALRVAYPRYQHLASPPSSPIERLMGKYIARENSNVPLFTRPDSRDVHLLLFNNMGNRQHRNFSERDLRDGMNVAFFGDSFTENSYIAAQYSFTEILDYLLNHAASRDEPHPINVLNFGYDGKGPDFQYVRYRSIKDKVKLDHVFYVFCHNDIEDIRRNAVLSHKSKDLIDYIRKPFWIRWLSSLHSTYLALDAWHRLKIAVGTQNGELDLDAARMLRDIVLKWRAEVEANGGEFHVVILPVPNTARIFSETDLSASSLTILDMEPAFKEAFPDIHGWRFETDSHWHEAGNMVAADFLYRFLERRLELPTINDEALSEARYVYYQAFAQDSDMESMDGLRWTPSSRWTKPRAFAEQEAAGIRAKYLSLNFDYRQKHFDDWFRKREPIARGGGWDVHMYYQSIYYLKENCGSSDPTTNLFLHVLAPNNNTRWDILEEIPLGDANERSMWYQGNKCYVKRYLEYWPLAGIHTGEYREDKLLWERTFAVASMEEVASILAPHRKRYEALAGREPIARSRWNVHVLGREIVHVKDPCYSVDLEGDFIMRVLPTPSVKDSELERPRENDGFTLIHWYGFYEMHGNSETVASSMFDGKCILTYLLPDFPVAAVKTGQRDMWEVTFDLDIETNSARTGPRASVPP